MDKTKCPLCKEVLRGNFKKADWRHPVKNAKAWMLFRHLCVPEGSDTEETFPECVHAFFVRKEILSRGPIEQDLFLTVFQLHIRDTAVLFGLLSIG